MADQEVTNALLKQGQEHIIGILEDVRDSLKNHTSRIGVLETRVAVSKEKWISHDRLHKIERGILSAIAFGFSTIAGVVSTFWQKP